MLRKDQPQPKRMLSSYSTILKLPQQNSSQDRLPTNYSSSKVVARGLHRGHQGSISTQLFNPLKRKAEIKQKLLIQQSLQL